MTLEAVGMGAGRPDLGGRPNVVQVLDRVDDGRGAGRTTAVVLEANVDDVTGEVLAHTIARLLAAGAQDAWVTPIVMKKGRPAHTVARPGRPGRRRRRRRRADRRDRHARGPGPHRRQVAGAPHRRGGRRRRPRRAGEGDAGRPGQGRVRRRRGAPPTPSACRCGRCWSGPRRLRRPGGDDRPHLIDRRRERVELGQRHHDRPHLRPPVDRAGRAGRLHDDLEAPRRRARPARRGRPGRRCRSGRRRRSEGPARSAAGWASGRPARSAAGGPASAGTWRRRRSARRGASTGWPLSEPGEHGEALVEHPGPAPVVELLAEAGQLAAAGVEAQARGRGRTGRSDEVVEGRGLAGDDPRPAAGQGVTIGPSWTRVGGARPWRPGRSTGRCAAATGGPVDDVVPARTRRPSRRPRRRRPGRARVGRRRQLVEDGQRQATPQAPARQRQRASMPAAAEQARPTRGSGRRRGTGRGRCRCACSGRRRPPSARWAGADEVGSRRRPAAAS